MSVDKDDIVYQAKLAEQAERYDGKNFFIFESMYPAVIFGIWSRSPSRSHISL